MFCQCGVDFGLPGKKCCNVESASGHIRTLLPGSVSCPQRCGGTPPDERALCGPTEINLCGDVCGNGEAQRCVDCLTEWEGFFPAARSAVLRLGCEDYDCAVEGLAEWIHQTYGLSVENPPEGDWFVIIFAKISGLSIPGEGTTLAEDIVETIGGWEETPLC